MIAALFFLKCLDFGGVRVLGPQFRGILGVTLDWTHAQFGPRGVIGVGEGCRSLHYKFEPPLQIPKFFEQKRMNF